MSDLIKFVIEIDSNIIYAIQNNKGVTLGNQIDICNAIKNGKYLSENRGEWKAAYKGGRKLCTNCGAFNNSKHKNFCPNCGADMRPKPYKAESEDKL